jgi:ketosteroid isomerase-like protein
MSIESNKKLVLAWFKEAFGGNEPGSGMRHPDFRFWVPGDMEISGWKGHEGFAEAGKVIVDFLDGPMTYIIGNVTAEDDRVLVELETRAPLKTGREYNNHYILHVTVRDDKIYEFREFQDTLHVYRSFGENPMFQPEQRPRESPITTVTDTSEGTPSTGGTRAGT